MSDTVGAQGQGRAAETIDLSVLERIEGELDAVERALEQIDQGVYEGFAGVGQVAPVADVTEAAAASAVPEPEDTEPTTADVGPGGTDDEGPAGYI